MSVPPILSSASMTRHRTRIYGKLLMGNNTNNFKGSDDLLKPINIFLLQQWLMYSKGVTANAMEHCLQRQTVGT